jgi:hypothetical protein
MPITIGFFLWERINHFPFISYGKHLFGIRPVWYKSKDLERIKDVYRGTTVLRLVHSSTRMETMCCSEMPADFHCLYGVISHKTEFFTERTSGPKRAEETKQRGKCHDNEVHN